MMPPTVAGISLGCNDDRRVECAATSSRTDPTYPTMRLSLTVPFAAALVLRCLIATAQQPAGTVARPPAFARTSFDTSCAPCRDFYGYANGGWIKQAQIPAAYPGWGTFFEVSDRTDALARQVIMDAARDVNSAPRKSNAWKIGTFYAACMDTARIESLGTKPIQPLLAVIASIKTADDLARAMGPLERMAGLAPFSIATSPDLRNTSRNALYAGQGGLLLPNRDYYTRNDARSEAMRRAYTSHVAEMLELIGEPAEQAEGAAQRILALESRLAGASMSSVQLRDPNAQYNKMSVADLQRLAPHLQWTRYLGQLGLKGVNASTAIVVRQPDFFRTLDTLLVTVPVDDWRVFMRWRAVNGAARALPSAFVNQDFEFQRNLSGARSLLPRERRCGTATNAALGEAVGQEYVKRAFTAEGKARALKMVDNLQAVLRERIGQLDWMSDSTRVEALAKLDAFGRKIGYPDRWRDYSTLQVKPGAHIENLRAVMQWSSARDWAKLGKPVDRSEWFVVPFRVDAFYNAANNEITFPAGILQPPFFDPAADDAVNYGAIGAVIGHEMTHGFDDQGRQFDASGNLRDWWTKADAENYNARAKLVMEQFDAYTVLDSATHVNGKLTLGENIADLGGLKIAFLSLQKALAQSGRPGPIDGYTPEQRFFLSYAQVWRQITRPEALRMRLNVDTHAPLNWRVNGPLSNMPEFAAAWGCSAGDPMVRPDSLRARIW
jgi:putative endopeptidase